MDIFMSSLVLGAAIYFGFVHLAKMITVCMVLYKTDQKLSSEELNEFLEKMK